LRFAEEDIKAGEEPVLTTAKDSALSRSKVEMAVAEHALMA
jgi:hypothetical protein